MIAIKIGDVFLESFGQKRGVDEAERSVGDEIEKVVGGFERKVEEGEDGRVEADVLEINAKGLVFDEDRVKEKRGTNGAALNPTGDGEDRVEEFAFASTEEGVFDELFLNGGQEVERGELVGGCRLLSGDEFSAYDFVGKEIGDSGSGAFLAKAVAQERGDFFKGCHDQEGWGKAMAICLPSRIKEQSPTAHDLCKDNGFPARWGRSIWSRSSVLPFSL